LVQSKRRRFINHKLAQGQYFFKEIYNDGILLYDNGDALATQQELTPEEQKRIAQDYFDDAFTTAKGFYDSFEHKFKKQDYKLAAFMLHQAAEHAYKAVLLVFTSQFPREHYLEILGNRAASMCDAAFGRVFPKGSPRNKYLFELLDYAYLGARYDPKYKITKGQLNQLAPRVQKLHEVTERVCKEKIDSFVV